MPQTPDLTDVIEGAIDSALDDVAVARPGRVVSFNKADSTANIQPAIKLYQTREDGSKVVVIPPVIPNVPVCFPGGGLAGITFPLNAGDTGLLVFCDGSIDSWKTGVDTRLAEAANPRKHHITDAVFIPGVRTMKRAALGGASMVDDIALTINAPSIKLGGTDASDPVVRRSDLDAVVTWLLAHVHVAPGGSTAIPTVTVPALTTPACSPFVKSK